MTQNFVGVQTHIRARGIMNLTRSRIFFIYGIFSGEMWHKLTPQTSSAPRSRKREKAQPTAVDKTGKLYQKLGLKFRSNSTSYFKYLRSIYLVYLILHVLRVVQPQAVYTTSRPGMSWPIWCNKCPRTLTQSNQKNGNGLAFNQA